MSESQLAADRSPTVRSDAVARPRTICSKATNDPRFVHGVDGRSVLMRRRRDLIAIFVDALGGEGALSAAGMLSVTRAADAVAIAEDHRARALRGEPVVLDDLVRLENAASRAVKALGIKRTARDATPSLHEYLAATAEAKPA
jgi:hypothetical protein